MVIEAAMAYFKAKYGHSLEGLSFFMSHDNQVPDRDSSYVLLYLKQTDHSCRRYLGFVIWLGRPIRTNTLLPFQVGFRDVEPAQADGSASAVLDSSF
jgi:hypothetical protein